jgi:hypothetical protein
MVSRDKCPWCDKNRYGCSRDENCDFRSLPMEKKAIEGRIDKEAKEIRRIKDEMAFDNRDILNAWNELSDRMRGLEVMAEVLQTDFCVSEDEIKRLMKPAKQGLAGKTKLMLRMAQLKAERGKK